jgi:acyl carrier protein
MENSRIPEICRVVAEALGIEPDSVDREAAMGLVENWDSLAQFSIAAAIESHFERKIPFEMISRLDSVQKIADFLSGA